MIPPLIHQMWIDPSAGISVALPRDLAESSSLWSALNAGHVRRLWLLSEVLDLCVQRNRRDVAAAIAECRFPSMQTDVARLFLLESFGGFWSDLKLRPRQPIPPDLHAYETVLVEHFPKAELPEPRGLLVNGFIGAAPGAPLITTALALVLKNIERRQGDGVFGISGPGALTLAARSFRLANPERSRLAHVIPHARAWGVLWDVIPDTYNPPGMHWAERQQRESTFVADTSVAGAADETGMFLAVPGHSTRIDRVVSRQGFHPFEPASGFCWLADAGPSRIFFDAFLPFDRLRLRIYAPEGYRLSKVVFRINGQNAAGVITAYNDGWSTIELGPFASRSTWNELLIVPPFFVDTRGGDSRKLSIAIGAVEPWVGEPFL